MDLYYTYFNFAKFYSDTKYIVFAIANLSNTYGSLRRVPLSKLSQFANSLFSLLSENKKLHHDIISLLRKDLDSGTEKTLRQMLKYYNMLLIISLYLGFDLNCLK
jgi:hypothetical protein